MNHPDILDSEEKRGPGRPKKPVEIDFDSLSENEKILFSYKDGKSDYGVCAAVEITKEEFDQRCKDDSKFRRLISFGRTLCQATWEEAYNEARKGGNFKAATMINFAMKNMFGWAEKSETTNSDILNIEGMTLDEARQKLRELGPNITDILEAKSRVAR